MKPITFVVPRFLPHLGGIEQHVFELSTRVAAAGHDVEVVTQREPVDLPERETIGGLEVSRVAARAHFRGQGNVSPDLVDAVRCARAAGRLVHVHNYHVPTSLAAVRAGGVDAVFTPHFLGSRTNLIDRVVHRGYAIAARRAIDAAGAIVHVSESERTAFEAAVGRHPEKTVVVPNGVAVDALRSAVTAHTTSPTILVAGRLEEYKQVDRVVAAMLHLPGVHLAIAGDGRDRPAIDSLITSLGLTSRVSLLGQLTPEELRTWYRAAAVVVSLSRRECFGMTLSEAIAAGCAIVATDLPAHRDVLRLAGMATTGLVPPDLSIVAVARVIAARLALPRPEPVAMPTWDDVAERTLEVYAAVSERRHVAARPVVDSLVADVA